MAPALTTLKAEIKPIKSMISDITKIDMPKAPLGILAADLW
jgi:hypothetical protein